MCCLPSLPTPQCPELCWPAGPRWCHPFLSSQEEQHHIKVSARLVTLMSKRMHRAGACFCFVIHHSCGFLKYSSDKQAGLIFRLKKRMHCQLPHSATVLVASKGLSPTLVSSAEHGPSKKLPYQPAASCVFQLFKIPVLTETCSGGIPVLLRQQMRAAVRGKALARDPKGRTV